MKEQVRSLLREVRPEADFEASLDFVSDGLLDSFDIVALVSALDRSFGVSIPGVEIVPENFQTIDAVVALVQRQGPGA